VERYKVVSEYTLVYNPNTGNFNPAPVQGEDGMYSPVPLWEQVHGGWYRYWGTVELNGGMNPIHDYASEEHQVANH
jgi:hypothetical protein